MTVREICMTGVTNRSRLQALGRLEYSESPILLNLFSISIGHKVHLIDRMGWDWCALQFCQRVIYISLCALKYIPTTPMNTILITICYLIRIFYIRVNSNMLLLQKKKNNVLCFWWYTFLFFERWRSVMHHFEYALKVPFVPFNFRFTVIYIRLLMVVATVLKINPTYNEPFLLKVEPLPNDLYACQAEKLILCFNDP